MLDPETLWQTRVIALKEDLQRLWALVDNESLKSSRDRLRLLLAPLEQDLERLHAGAEPGAGMPERWQALSALSLRSHALTAALLELLGGAGISQGLRSAAGHLDGGYSERAETWLRGLGARAGTADDFVIIAGQGPLLALPPRVTAIKAVRLPFLDWDLWHLPLLARAVGLLATVAGPFSAALEGVSAEVKAFTSGQATVPFQSASPHVLQLLLAELLAVALAGPAYALSVFALELDYLAPAIAPATGEGLLTPAQRAAAVLFALEVADEHGQHASDQLAKVWTAAVATTAVAYDPLPDARAALASWLQALAEAIGLAALPSEVRAGATWHEANNWFRALGGAQGWPHLPPLTPSIATTTSLVGGLWLHRYSFPEHARAAHAMVAALLSGENVSTPHLVSAPQATVSVPVEARLQALQARRERLVALLDHPQLADMDRAAVAGRFRRLLSDQEYGERLATAILKGGGVRRGVWNKLAVHEEDSRRWRQEALEFFGGLFLYYRQLDREVPANQDQSPGPSASDVAGVLLRAYARATGVNWIARTVPGQDPLIALDTEVIRTRFPDWSLWSLPLMAHEFGHLVAFNTPAFRDYQAEQQAGLLRDHPRPPLAVSTYEQERIRHLDELFADMFALYTFGPAYAYCVFALYLDPVTAYTARGTHPTHDERAAATIEALRVMDRQAGSGIYGSSANKLEQGWQQALTAVTSTPADAGVHDFLIKQSMRWAGRSLGLVDRFYRLGAAFTAADWQCARSLGDRLYPDVPGIAELQSVAKSFRLPGVTLRHLVNALWYRRLREPARAGFLSKAGTQLGLLVLPLIEERNWL
jgi:hypothetical protein